VDWGRGRVSRIGTRVGRLSCGSAKSLVKTYTTMVSRGFGMGLVWDAESVRLSSVRNKAR